MINLGDAVLFFKGDMNDLDAALARARQEADGHLGAMKQMAQEVGMAMTAMGAAIVGGLGLAVTNFANTGDEINDMSKKIGMSTEEVSKWGYALGQSGGDLSTLQTAVRGLAANMDQELQGALTATNDGLDQQSSAFQRMGLDVQQLRALKPEDQFMRVAMAVAGVSDPMERAALAQQIFGRAGMELLPVLSEGEAGIREMFSQAERAGAVFTAAEAAMGDQFNDAVGKLTESLQGASKELALALIPDLIKFIGYVTETVIGVKDWAKANPELASTLVQVVGGIGVFLSVAGPILVVLPGLATAFSFLGTAAASVGGVFAAVAGMISLPVIATVAAIAAIGYAAYTLYENWDAVAAFFGDFWNNLQGMTEQAADAIRQSDVFQGLGESAETWTAYAAERMGAFAGWVAGNFAQALTDPVQFITEYWSWIGDLFNTIVIQIGNAWDYLMTNIIEPAMSKIQEIWAWLSEVFMQGFDSAAASAQGVAPAEGVPGMATGGMVTGAGLAWVGEHGPELVNLPRGAQVIPHDQSMAMAGGGGAVVNITIGGVTLPTRAAMEEFNRGLGEEVARRISMRGLSPRLA